MRRWIGTYAPETLRSDLEIHGVSYVQSAMRKAAHKTAKPQQQRRRKTADSASEKTVRRGQHERLLDTVTELSAQSGYPQPSIIQVSEMRKAHASGQVR